MFDLGPSRARGRLKKGRGSHVPTRSAPPSRASRRPGRRGGAVPWRRRARWPGKRVRDRSPKGWRRARKFASARLRASAQAPGRRRRRRPERSNWQAI